MKVIARQGFILSNASYPFSGDVTPDPDQMTVPIVCSTVPHWATVDRFAPGPENRIRNRDGVTIVIHARASYLEEGHGRLITEEPGLLALLLRAVSS